MANQTLRELAKEYAQGNLDKDSYRKSRAELIQGIISSKIPLQEIDYPPLVQPPEPEVMDITQRKEESKKPAAEAEPTATTSAKPGSNNTASNDVDAGARSSSKILLISVVLAVIAVIIIGVLSLNGDKESKPRLATGESRKTAAPQPAASTPAMSRAHKLIQGFLGNNNWSGSALEEFQQQWADLSSEETEAARDSLAMGQLTNAIYKQLLEEQALSGLVEDDSSLNKQRQLVQFASGLGIEDDRISLPEGTQALDNLMD